jgi:hypothetical protein
LEPPASVVFKIVDGDHQEGPVKAYAATALIVQAEDAAGSPLAGLPITWNQPVNGRVIPLSATT